VWSAAPFHKLLAIPGVFMSRSTRLLPAYSLFVCAVLAQQETALPIKRVVLYKNGVGYFEHLGKVNGNQTISVPFTSAQLNDVLKTLTILDLNGGRIGSVLYGSPAPLDGQSGQLRLSGADKSSLTEILGALRGARIEIKNAATVMSGRLLSVERKTRMGSGATLEVDYVSLLTDSGEVRTTEISPGFSFRLLEKGLTSKVEQYLDVFSAGREPDVRRMAIAAEGNGDRSLFMSYISEVPVWKATYRIVLRPSGPPLLQGWAIVDNTLGQDWRDVQLSLVAGAPQSFVQNLSQPFYSRRPVLAVAQSAMMTPQTFEAALTPAGARLSGRVTDVAGGVVQNALVRLFDSNGGRAGEKRTGMNGEFDFSGLPDGVYRVQVESLGFRQTAISGIVATSSSPARRDIELQVGSTAETVTVAASAPDTINMSQSAVSRTSRRSSYPLRAEAANAGAPPSYKGISPQLLDAARANSETGADAQELGDLFEYKVKQAVTIKKNQSAMVPIVQAGVEAEKVSIWTESGNLRRPLRALWLKNSTGLTLDGGTFSVMEQETFAGEGVFDLIRPGEKRLVSYAVDLGLTATSKAESRAERISRVRIAKGVMIHERETREKKTYIFRNEDLFARSVIVEHPSRSGYTLKSDTKPIETTAGWMRFRIEVPSKQTVSLEVDEAQPAEVSYAVGDISPDQINVFVREKSISPEIEQALRKIIEQKVAFNDLEDQQESKEKEIEKIVADQQRLRENMKALKGSAEEKSLLQRYTQQLNSQENQLESLRSEVTKLERQVEIARAQLQRAIEALAFEVRL
jgi:hypothetical protein